jgi:SnoaL-like domain
LIEFSSVCLNRTLFTEDTHFGVYMDGQGSEPTQVFDGRGELAPVFDDLNRYQATMHFNGQSTIALDGDRATGESYCIANHLFTDDGERKLMVAWLRYHDTFVKQDDAWLFAERNLYVDWTETRPSHPSSASGRWRSVRRFSPTKRGPAHGWSQREADPPQSGRALQTVSLDRARRNGPHSGSGLGCRPDSSGDGSGSLALSGTLCPRASESEAEPVGVTMCCAEWMIDNVCAR